MSKSWRCFKPKFIKFIGYQKVEKTLVEAHLLNYFSNRDALIDLLLCNTRELLILTYNLLRFLLTKLYFDVSYLLTVVKYLPLILIVPTLYYYQIPICY